MYAIEGLENVREEVVDTPFGSPSDSYIIGEYQGAELVFLPRHGRGHSLTPSEVNCCAASCSGPGPTTARPTRVRGALGNRGHGPVPSRR